MINKICDIEMAIGMNENKVQQFGNHMVTALSLSLRVLLENPDDLKEKPLTCNLDSDIDCNQQTTLVYKRNEVINKIYHIRASLEDLTKHSMSSLTCVLEPDIVVR